MPRKSMHINNVGNAGSNLYRGGRRLQYAVPKHELDQTKTLVLDPCNITQKQWTEALLVRLFCDGATSPSLASAGYTIDSLLDIVRPAESAPFKSSYVTLVWDLGTFNVFANLMENTYFKREHASPYAALETPPAPEALNQFQPHVTHLLTVVWHWAYQRSGVLPTTDASRLAVMIEGMSYVITGRPERPNTWDQIWSNARNGLNGRDAADVVKLFQTLPGDLEPIRAAHPFDLVNPSRGKFHPRDLPFVAPGPWVVNYP